MVREPESDAFRRWAEGRGRELFSSDLLRTEVLGAARRLSSAVLAGARRGLDALTIIRLDMLVFERAGELDPRILRSLDAIHLAAALSIDVELQGIATYDVRLAVAASELGLAVVAPA